MTNRKGVDSPFWGRRRAENEGLHKTTDNLTAYNSLLYVGYY